MAKEFKILLLDIETAPALAFTWGIHNVNIGIDQIKTPGRVLCIGYKWLGSGVTFLASEWNVGHKKMLELVHKAMSEADAVIGYNSDKFDLQKLNGEFLMHGFEPLPPLTSIDVWKTAKKLGLISSKLEFVTRMLKIGEKFKHEGFKLWVSVLDGDKGAEDRMENYCIHDVDLLEEVYIKLRPWIKNHPHMSETKSHECGACGSNSLHSRGYRRTKTYKIQRLQCQECGSWQDGKKEKLE